MTDSRERTSDLHALPDDGREDALEALSQQPAVAELRRSLRKLPEIEPAPEVWARIQARTNHTRTKNARAPGAGYRERLMPFALAAGLLVAVAAGILSLNVLTEGDFPAELSERQVASVPVGDSALRALRDRSRLLEPIAQRRASPSDPFTPAVRFRIADLDSQLSSAPEGRLDQAETQRLWGQRVALLESLAEIRRARAALQPAVY